MAKAIAARSKKEADDLERLQKDKKELEDKLKEADAKMHEAEAKEKRLD